MKKLVFLVFVISAFTVFGQNNINAYKYVIVPKKFDFLKKPDQYKTSGLTKFLLKENGFTAFFNDEKLPDDLASNKCLALTAIIKDNSGFLVTKSIVEFRDCFGKVIYKSSEGKSRKKDYRRAYQEAIRNAFKSVAQLKYSYTPNTTTIVKEEVKTKVTTPVVTKVVPKTSTVTNNSKVTVLYAQALANGYQLVNTKPEVVFMILKTSLENVFIIKDKNGILYKKGNTWIAEIPKTDGSTTQDLYEIKF